MNKETIEFLLNAAENLYAPDIELNPDLPPMFYHTLTYEGDMDLINKTKEARRLFNEKFGETHE